MRENDLLEARPCILYDKKLKRIACLYNLIVYFIQKRLLLFINVLDKIFSRSAPWVFLYSRFEIQFYFINKSPLETKVKKLGGF